MKNLDHWNIIHEFTGAQAACLIVGVDPTNPNAKTYKSDPLLVRLKAAYSLALKRHATERYGRTRFYPRAVYEDNEELDLVSPISDQAEPLPPALHKERTRKQIFGMTRASVTANDNLQDEDGVWLNLGWPQMELDPAALQSTATLEIHSEIFPQDLSMETFGEPTMGSLAHEAWLVTEDSSFKEQKFSREELHRWLGVVGIESVYRFGPSPLAVSSPIESPTSNRISLEWPAHETKNLCALRAAAFFWDKKYKKGDDTTAPTNEEVSKFLQSEHRIAPTLADSMATILRADELKTGPRTGPKK